MSLDSRWVGGSPLSLVTHQRPLRPGLTPGAACHVTSLKDKSLIVGLVEKGAALVICGHPKKQQGDTRLAWAATHLQAAKTKGPLSMRTCSTCLGALYPPLHTARTCCGVGASEAQMLSRESYKAWKVEKAVRHACARAVGCVTLLSS